MTTMPADRATVLNILLIEDDDGDAKAVMRAFKEVRIANPIVRARDGIEALEIMRGRHEKSVHTPYVVLVDVSMPRMNGHEFLSEMRKDPALEGTITFMLTTSDDPVDIDRAYHQHVAGYIVKDRAGEDFIDLVEAVEGLWRIVEFPYQQAP